MQAGVALEVRKLWLDAGYCFLVVGMPDSMVTSLRTRNDGRWLFMNPGTAKIATTAHTNGQKCAYIFVNGVLPDEVKDNVLEIAASLRVFEVIHLRDGASFTKLVDQFPFSDKGPISFCVANVVGEVSVEPLPRDWQEKLLSANGVVGAPDPLVGGRSKGPVPPVAVPVPLPPAPAKLSKADQLFAAIKQTATAQELIITLAQEVADENLRLQQQVNSLSAQLEQLPVLQNRVLDCEQIIRHIRETVAPK